MSISGFPLKGRVSLEMIFRAKIGETGHLDLEIWNLQLPVGTKSLLWPTKKFGAPLTEFVKFCGGGGVPKACSRKIHLFRSKRPVSHIFLLIAKSRMGGGLPNPRRIANQLMDFLLKSKYIFLEI